jgi:hypothetical protein
MTDPVLGAIGQLDAAHPITLMPLRLETRFRRGPVAGSPDTAGELLVRIYPDSILADSHEPLLSQNEVAAGQDYWRRAFADGRENDAWTALLGEVRTPRAAWIVAQTTPSNVDQMAGRGATPAFPTLQTRPESWHQAPRAHGLPERWVISGFRGGERVMQVVGAPIRADLALTPRLVGDDTSAPRVDLSGDGLTVEPELAWAYDLAEAVQAGMAVRIPLSSIDMEDGFSTLLVVGLRTTTTADEQANDLADLLQAHQFSRGLGFVRQGTRTNNTGNGPSDYPPADPAGTVSFAVARGAPTANSGTDGGRFAAALGLPLSTVEHLAGAGRDEQSPAQAMVNALWPATIGYFLDQLFAPEVSQATVDAVRAWMQQWVRPRGPLPALRVGAVPYGVLPVAPLAAPPSAAPVGNAPPRLAGLVSRLAGIAATLVAGAPHVGRTTDPDRDLIELLGMDASASTARVRRTLGYDAAWNMFGFTGTDMARWETAQRQVGQTVLTAIGEAGRDPRAAYLSFAGRSDDFGGPMVAPAPLSETDPLPFDYIAWLATATPAQLRAQTAPPSDQPVTALLYLMLRHALLTEYDRTARRVLDLHGLLFAHEARETELIGILAAPPSGPPRPVVRGQPVPLPVPPPPQTRTAWDRFDMQVTGVTGNLTLGQFLADNGGPGTPSDIKAALRELADLRAALGTLTGLPTAELHRLFTETLDACSHRIDAWVTSLVTSRLAALRGATPGGTWLGCYGWVEDLRADPAGDRVDVTLPDGTTAKAQRDDAGFVTAPSMTHAATAAVLRSAYLARSGAAQEPYTVDLSSQRVRRALALLDAVRDEQPLGSVLGAAFERGLHEGHPGIELDRFIDPLRRLYPAVAGKTEATGEPSDAVAARSIVDGLALLQRGIPWGTGELTPSTQERAAVESELAALAESVDAVSDLLLAESVFQVVKGSPSGAAATLDTLATGRRPPEPEVVAAPRGGTVLHQRIAVLFGAGALPPAWAGVPPTPRAAAAPEVNAWLATLIGDPSQMECAAPTPVTLAQLGLHPIDLLQLSSSDLNALIVAHAGAPATVDYDAARPGRTPLGAVLELLRAAAELLGVGRALTSVDLLPPERATTPAADAMESELDGRAAGAVRALTQAGADLTTAQPNPPDAMLRDVAARFGITGPGPDVLAVVNTRLAAAANAASAADRLAAVFGRGFPVVPRFRPAAADLLGPALAAEPGLTDDPDSVVEGWLAQLARVRPAVRAWCDVRMLGRALGASIARPRIAQLGDTPRWAGLPFGTEEQRPRSGLVSLALAGASAPAPEQPWSGLLLDSWPEILPNREEDAGLAFHYDAPGSQAPQAILIAVSLAGAPGTAGTWSYEQVERTLLDTLTLAKIRALDLSNLGAFAQLVPMTFLAANQANAAVSTSFQGLLVADAVVTTPGGS